MFRWAFVIATLVLSLECRAEPYHAFIGAAWQFGTIGETYPQYAMYAADAGSPTSTGIRFHSSGGQRVEIGLTRRHWSMYVGFQDIGYKYERRDEFLNYFRTIMTNRFRSDRLLLGFRLVSQNPSRVHPLIGVSLSGGWARYSITEDQTIFSNGQVIESYHHRVSQLSKFSGGFGGEAGALIRLYRSLEASLIGHFDYINSQIGTRDSGWMGQIDKNLLVTLQSGLQYHFRH